VDGLTEDAAFQRIAIGAALSVCWGEDEREQK
jgi:hypothetical protein